MTGDAIQGIADCNQETKKTFCIYAYMEGLIIAMIVLAFVDVGVEYYLYQGVRVNEMIIALLGVLYLCL